MDDKFFLAIVDKFNTTDIAELEFDDGNTRLILRKESAFLQKLNMQTPIEKSVPVSEEHSVRLGIHGNTNGEISGGGENIKSPIVATFYSAPGPDAPPFVKSGTKVKIGQTLCILEAMKMMNHLEAEFDCEIIDVHARSGELVEYGQKLFTVKRN